MSFAQAFVHRQFAEVLPHGEVGQGLRRYLRNISGTVFSSGAIREPHACRFWPGIGKACDRRRISMSALDTSSTGLQVFLSPKMMQSTVLPVMRQQASAPEPTLARICSHHLGFIDEHGDPSSAEGGKPTRAALVVPAADGVGPRPEDVRCRAGLPRSSKDTGATSPSTS
jgi:hypothetical protein